MLKLHTEHLAVIGIQTAPGFPNYQCLCKESPLKAELWKEFYDKQINSKDSIFSDTLDHAQAYRLYGGLYADYGRITNVTITVFLRKTEKNNEEPTIVSLSIVGTDEREILRRANKILSKKVWIGGHNMINFVIPFFSRRTVINGLFISDNMNVMQKKPWDMNFYDTMYLWNFGGSNMGTSSLKSIADSLMIQGVDDICRGCDMTNKFWNERDYEMIAKQTEHNSSVVMKILLKLENPETDSNTIPLKSLTPEIKLLDVGDDYFGKNVEESDIFTTI